MLLYKLSRKGFLMTLFHYFGDGDLLDGLTGGDGHLDLIKVHVHDDN